MITSKSPPIVSFDYAASPYKEKVLILLATTGTSFVRVDVPPILPRPQLEALGITYRLIPVLAIGKDVFCDSAAILQALLELGIADGIPQSKADKAYEAWGNVLFQSVLSLVPNSMLTEAFVKDRETVFPILRRPDIDQLRPSSLGAARQALSNIEHDFLAGEQPYITGKELGLADIHIGFVVRWILEGLGVGYEKGFSKEDFPKVWKWIESFPASTASYVQPEEAHKIILSSDYAFASVQTRSDDPLAHLLEKDVTVESFDTDVGAHPQIGKLIGCGVKEIVLGLNNGIRLHFPRLGYYVKPAAEG